MLNTARTHFFAAVLILALGLAVGCGPKQPDSRVASFASEAAYAERFPSALESAKTDFDKREQEARTVLDEIPGYSEGLDNPDWKRVQEIINAADSAGRTEAYADRMKEVRAVTGFFEEEKTEIGRKAGGAAQYAAKQGGCEVQIGGAVTGALDKAVEKQLEKRLRERNEAQLLIVRYGTSLGEKNAETLATRVDHLTYASYVTWIELTETKRRIEDMVKEAEQVSKTADGFIAAEEAFQKEAGRTDAEKADSAARATAMRDSKAKASAAVQAAQTALEPMQQRIEKLQKDYEVIVGSMKSELERRAGSK